MKNASLFCILASHLSERWGAYEVYFTMLPQNHFQEVKFPVWTHSNTIPISDFCWDHVFQSLLIGSVGICLQLCLVFHFSAVERNGVGLRTYLARTSFQNIACSKKCLALNMPWEAVPLGWWYFTLYDSADSVAPSLSHFATPNNINGRRRKWFIQQELQQEF